MKSWESTPSRERFLYKLIAGILLTMTFLSVISMTFIGFTIIGNWFISMLIGLFFSFLFFNIYRFALVSMGVVLGRISPNIVSSIVDSSDPQKTQKIQKSIKSLFKFLTFSFIIRIIVVTLIGYIISFGWNLAINWSDVRAFNTILNSRQPIDVENGIFLSQTAIYLSKQPQFYFWCITICGLMLLGLRIKSRLVNIEKYEYVKLTKSIYEQQIAVDYNQLYSFANAYFKSHNIRYEFDFLWKNPPFKTDLKQPFRQKTSVDIETLTKGKSQ